MNALTRRIAGYLLLTAAVIGVVISITGIIFIKTYIDKTRNVAMESVDKVYEMMGLADTTLNNLSDSIDKISQVLVSLEGMTNGVAGSVNVAVPTLDELSKIVGDELPKTVSSMQSSLDAAAVSAKNVDNVLLAISKIPLLGAIVYNPDQPLSATLLDVADSLDNMPESLTNMQKGIDSATANLKDANLNMENVTKSVTAITGNVDSAKQSIEEYKKLTNSLQVRVKSIGEDVPRFMNLFTFVTIGSLVWLLLAQISLFLQGLDLINTKVVNIVQIQDPAPKMEKEPGYQDETNQE